MSGLDATDYLNRAKRLLQKQSQVQALSIVKEGLEVHPENAFLLSYYGALSAIVARDYKGGVRAAERALKQLMATVPLDAETHYPTFYLNIARAYLASGDRAKAILALKKGLKYDSLNPEILETMDSLGVRRRPPSAGLRRTHPLNKYIGLLLHKLGNPVIHFIPHFICGNWPKLASWHFHCKVEFSLVPHFDNFRRRPIISG